MAAFFRVAALRDSSSNRSTESGDESPHSKRRTASATSLLQREFDIAALRHTIIAERAAVGNIAWLGVILYSAVATAPATYSLFFCFLRDEVCGVGWPLRSV